MKDDELIELEKLLGKALQEYDWTAANGVCDQIIEDIYKSDEPFSVAAGKRLLSGLRRKGRFQLMSGLAEAIIGSGQIHPQIKRQYAQSLIDQGFLSAAKLVVKEIQRDPELSPAETLEASGLSGRIFKQRFVNLSPGHSKQKRSSLDSAVSAYFAGYQSDNSSYWHAINTVALLKRGHRDNLDLSEKIDSNKLAEEILETLNAKNEDSVEPPNPWEMATIMEAQIATGRFDEAAETALEYGKSPGTDAFEINSTLRQLIEIWQLTDNDPPGDKLLPILRSALLDRNGGSVTLNPKEAAADVINLEGIFGDNAPKTIKWYKNGLERSNSIVRIETRDGKGIGTAGLVKSGEFFDGSDGFLLITNAHVVSVNPADSGLPPHKVIANFQGIGQTFEIGEVVWSSSQRDLDTSLLSFKGDPGVDPLPIAESHPQMSEPAPRVYVIGYPSGRDLEISLNDNRMVGSNQEFVHYRTPTEPGSSGSPVFDQFGWEVVALHHGGSDVLPRIDGETGTYQANEGISILAIKRAIQRGRQIQ